MKKFTVAGSSLGLILCLALSLGGCRSAFVSTTITNRGNLLITLLEVDYPSASFGIGALAPGADFHYRFKIQGSGPVKLQFTDAAGKAHSVSGPDMIEGEQGTLSIVIGPADEISWVPNLTKIR